MTRRLLNLLTALSLLLCAAALAFWARSYRYADSLGWPWSTERHAYLFSAHGVVAFHDLGFVGGPNQLASGYSTRHLQPHDDFPTFAGTGFAGFRTYSNPPIQRLWTAPYWFIAAVAAAWPGAIARLTPGAPPVR